MEYTIKITKNGETMTTAIQYAKKRGLNEEEAKVFSALFNQHPNLKNNLVFIRNDVNTPYVQEWIDRCKKLWKIIRVGDNKANDIMRKVIGYMKYQKLMKISNNPTWADY
jgi:hypothetical protein